MKRLLKKVSVVLLATAGGLLVAEPALRLFSPRYYPIIPAAYEYDPELAHRLRPGAHLFQTTDHQQETVANSLGTANFQEGFEGYESLVFAVGDSHTQGRGAMPGLALDNHHSGEHHRAWVNQVIAAEFARQIRAGR